MAELTLDRDLRLTLKAQAHALDPVVLLGAAGLTDAVLAEIDRALQAHCLVKVRVPLDERTERDAIFAGIADRLEAARVHAIGKVVVLYRPPPDAKTAAPARTRNRTGATEPRSTAVARRRQT